MVRVWSIGYEGLTPQSLVAALRQAGVDTLADVRERPQSRKPGFSKTALSRSLADAGISYVHLRDLGTPASVRAEYHATGDVEELRQAYRHHLEEHEAAVDQLESLAQRRRVAMLCVERDEAACHRHVLGERLRAHGHDVVALEPDLPEMAAMAPQRRRTSRTVQPARRTPPAKRPRARKRAAA